MIKLVKHSEYEFEMPKSCRECPGLYHYQDGNASLPSCKFLHGGYESVVDDKPGYKSPECPLEDNHTYVNYR